MSVSTTLATPLTLVKDQALSIPKGTNEINCFNDSGLKQRHYRTIPNDTSAEGQIRWANLPSIAIPNENDYAVAVSMSEYIYAPGVGLQLMKNAIEGTAQGVLFTDPNDDYKKYAIDKSATVTLEGAHVVFRKVVWVRASELVLGSVSQQKAIATAEEKKQQDYLDGLSKSGQIPSLANNNTTNSKSIIWIIVGVLFLLILGIWALIAKAKKKGENSNDSKQNINVIRLPKSS